MLLDLLDREDFSPRELAAHVICVPLFRVAKVLLQVLQILLEVLADPLNAEEGPLIPVLAATAMSTLHNLHQIRVDRLGRVRHGCFSVQATCFKSPAAVQIFQALQRMRKGSGFSISMDSDSITAMATLLKSIFSRWTSSRNFCVRSRICKILF
jgi:hypothetical protein